MPTLTVTRAILALRGVPPHAVEGTELTTGGGVIVLKSGQIFGGDGARYYLGIFTAKGTKLDDQLSIAWCSGPRKTVWGDEAKVVETRVIGEVGSDTITGNLERTGYPAIPIHMTKRADLPGPD